MPKIPERIISLVPSQTELLFDLGLEQQLVGVTKFCVHPGHLRKTKTIVGGTKNFHLDIIDSLQPDLIIGNKEENDRDGIERLAETYPVWMSDILTLEDNLNMIREMGEIFQKSKEANQIIKRLGDDLSKLLPPKGTAIYLIWNAPIMVAGTNTFINEMLKFAGFKNLIVNERYPILTEEELRLINPEFVLLSSEPFPFQVRHVEHFQEILPHSRILKVDGELFSWYGTRLLQSRRYFEELS
ncbi:helical backbone metal receptor [Algoriphagus sp. CAU 1675]|uniref:ABC transporter substrate-binding protein n=1 Tax=Algoriphagus sp. CAU 1675 TaxID=3032597 RepID=UPI0031F45E28